MADTSILLPTLPLTSSVASPPTRPTRSTSPLSGIPTTSTPTPLPADAAQVHYPVLVPNMRGLDNLLKLEEKHKANGGIERLTDEIAVFVSATEVSRDNLLIPNVVVKRNDIERCADWSLPIL